MLEKTLERPLDYKEIQPVHPKGDESWVCIGRTDVEAKTPVLWPPDVKSWLLGKDPDAGKDWGQEEKGTTEDEMVGWHHRLNDVGLGGPWSWWWTGRPGVLWYMGSQRVGHDWVTELKWTYSIHWSLITLEGINDVINSTEGNIYMMCVLSNEGRLSIWKKRLDRNFNSICLYVWFISFCIKIFSRTYHELL